MVQAELDRMQRVHGGQHTGVLQHSRQAQQGQHQEPGQHHRPEGLANAARAKALHGKQAGNHDEGEGQDGVVVLGA